MLGALGHMKNLPCATPWAIPCGLMPGQESRDFGLESIVSIALELRSGESPPSAALMASEMENLFFAYEA